MIELIFAPADWFTRYDPISLGRTIESGLDVLADVSVKGVQWDQELSLVLASCRTMRKTAEGAFALLRVAEVATRKGFIERGRDLIEEADGYISLPNDQKAILEWILGSFEWQLCKQPSGNNHWRNARALYNDLVKESVKEHVDDRTDWYRSCLKKLDGWVVDLAFSVKGGYLLLNRFTKSRFTPVAANMAQAIRKELGKKRASERTQEEAEKIRVMIRMLEKSTFSSEEGPEALLECGLMSIDNGRVQDINEGLRYLRLAEAKYNSDPDNLVVVYWIMGAALWGNDGMSQAALDNWRICQEKIKFLAENADRDRNKARLEWYKMLGEIVDLGVKSRVEQGTSLKATY